MEELKRQDRQRFFRGLLRWPASGLTAFGIVLFLAALLNFRHGFGWMAIAACVPLAFAAESALRWARAHEFRHPKLRYLWKMCEERLERFDEARRKHRKTDLPELIEMPATIERVGHALRLALRRADAILHEVEESEGIGAGETYPIPAPPVVGASSTIQPPMVPTAAPTFSPIPSPSIGDASSDDEARTLYRLADRNVAEYRDGLRALLAGVVRTEAQAALFATTLDTLRLKMLGFRLGPRRPEMETAEFVASVGEAKMQMNAIDRALEDLEINVFSQGGSPPPAVMDASGFGEYDPQASEEPAGRRIGE